jgi:hypothetical protein
MSIAKRKSGACIYLYGTKQILCASALRHYISIKRRTINSVKLGRLEPLETFTEVVGAWSGMVARDFTSRFNGVNIREGTITHVFYMHYDDDLYWMDKNTLFIDYQPYGNSKVRRFKLLSIKILDEGGEWMALQASERGDASLGATEC